MSRRDLPRRLTPSRLAATGFDRGSECTRSSTTSSFVANGCADSCGVIRKFSNWRQPVVGAWLAWLGRSDPPTWANLGEINKQIMVCGVSEKDTI